MLKIYLYVIFCISLLSANILANRIGLIGVFQVAGNPITYCVSFMCCDLINECYGKKEAKKLINSGFLFIIIFLVILYSTFLIPALDADFNKSFVTVFSNSARVLFASLVAYYVSNHIDIIIFNFFRNRNKSGVLRRKFYSTAISQLIDSFIFTVVAFFGILSLNNIFTIIYSEYIFKIIIVILLVPIYKLILLKINSSSVR